jgi:hypothetical protein
MRLTIIRPELLKPQTWYWEGSTPLTPYAQHTISVSVYADRDLFQLKTTVQVKLSGVETVRTVFTGIKEVTLPGMEAATISELMGSALVEKLLSTQRPFLLLCEQDGQWKHVMENVLTALSLKCIWKVAQSSRLLVG